MRRALAVLAGPDSRWSAARTWAGEGGLPGLEIAPLQGLQPRPARLLPNPGRADRQPSSRFSYAEIGARIGETAQGNRRNVGAARPAAGIRYPCRRRRRR